MGRDSVPTSMKMISLLIRLAVIGFAIWLMYYMQFGLRVPDGDETPESERLSDAEKIRRELANDPDMPDYFQDSPGAGGLRTVEGADGVILITNEPEPGRTPGNGGRTE